MDAGRIGGPPPPAAGGRGRRWADEAAPYGADEGTDALAVLRERRGEGGGTRPRGHKGPEEHTGMNHPRQPRACRRPATRE